jgi:O-antigen/teichoic acid export membrane protein
LGGNLAHHGAGLALMIVAANALLPASFGYFSTAVAYLWILTHGIDAGLTLTTIHLGARGGTQDAALPGGLFQAGLLIKGALSLIAVPGVWLISARLGMFEEASHLSILALVALGAFCLVLWLSVSSLFQVYRRFRIHALLNSLVAVGRLSGILLVMSQSILTAPKALLMYAAAPCVSIVIGMYALGGGLWRSWRASYPHVGRLIAFGKWVGIVAFCEILFERLDVLMLAPLEGYEAVGLYAAAKQMAAGLPLVTGAVATALLPRLSGMRDPEILYKYVIRYVRYMSYGLPVFVLLYAGAVPLLRLVYDISYGSIPSLFQIVLAAYTLNMFFQPLALILYALDRPRIRAMIALTQLAVGWLCYTLFIPWLGIHGAAIGLCVTTGIMGAVLGVTIHTLLRR